MVSQAHLDALRKIYQRLQGRPITWVVSASLNLALQGVPVEVHDIDIQTDAAGAYEIERLFAEYVTKRVAFSTTDRVRSHFGALLLGESRHHSGEDGIKVEIIGDLEKRGQDGSWEPAPDLQRHRRLVEVNGMQIPVLPLEYECEAYRKLGRLDKAQLIQTWLKEHSGEVRSCASTL